MKLTKRQILSLAVMNVVIVSLVIAMLMIPYFSKSVPVDADPDPDPENPPAPVHVKLRDSNVGKTVDILWENSLMGTGDENIVDAHYYNSVYYIFGNASVGDLDFDNYGGFLVRLNRYGNILGFTYFPEKLFSTGFFKNGFLAGLEGALCAVDTDGKILKTVDLGTATPIVDLLLLDNGYAAVLKTHDDTTNTDGLIITKLDFDLNIIGEHSVRRDESIEYITAFELNGVFTVAVNISTESYSCAAFAVFNINGNGEYKNINMAYSYRAYSVMPYSDGFFILARDKQGKAYIITVNSAYGNVESIPLDTPPVSSLSAHFCAGDYYIFLNFSGGISALYKYNSSMKFTSEVAAGADLKSVDLMNSLNGIPFMFGASSTNITASSINAFYQKRVAAKDCKIAFAHISNDGIMLAFTATGGTDIAQSSGGRDAYFIKLDV